MGSRMLHPASWPARTATSLLGHVASPTQRLRVSLFLLPGSSELVLRFILQGAACDGRRQRKQRLERDASTQCSSTTFFLMVHKPKFVLRNAFPVYLLTH